MSLLGGILHLDGATPVVDDNREPNDRDQHADHAGQFVDGPVEFHWSIRWTTPEAVGESLPIHSPDGRFVLAYSGRLDNREELIARYGMRASASDGELLVAALSRDGSTGLRHCVGDFVLASWDRVARRLWLARDALGHRPMYYVRDAHRVTWSTDFRSLRDGPARTARPNPGFLAEYMSGGIVSRDETVFDQIRRVPPARVISFTPDQAPPVVTEYWTASSSLPLRRSDDELIAEFRHRLETAVRACMRANGPLAAELSGGLDSSSIVALATAFGGVAPATYSMVFPGTPFALDGEVLDESAHIDVMVSAVGATSRRHDPRVTMHNDVWRVMRTHGDLADWPNADLVRWPMARGAAADGHRVLVTGLGGDQWLTGSVARLPGLICKGRLLEAGRFLRSAYGPHGLESLPGPLVSRVAAAALPRWAKRLFRAVRPAQPWPDWLCASFISDTDLISRLRALPSRVPAVSDPVLQDSLTRLASGEEVLAREHAFRTGNDAGVEIRHPFFDRRVVEFVLGLPDDLRFRDGQTRYILRQAMGRRLPPSIASRHDKGDATILRSLALSRMLSGVSLKSLCVADAGWVDGDRVRAATAPFQTANPGAHVPAGTDGEIWSVIAVEMWLRAIQT